MSATAKVRNHREKHARTGRMTNQPHGYDSTQPHASTNVCELEECQASARRWVEGVTGQPAVYVADPPAVRYGYGIPELLPCSSCRGRLTPNGAPCTRCTAAT